MVSIIILTALLTGYMATSFACVMFIVESSTFFLSIRCMFTEKGCCYVAISLLFAISYTVTRIIVFPIALLKLLPEMIGVWPYLDTMRRVSMLIGGTLAVALQGLFIFWFVYLILGIIKFCKGTQEP